MNIINKTHKLNDQDKINIVDLYCNDINSTCMSIARQYNIRNTSVRGVLRRRNIEIRNDASKLARKYTLDESFFEKIDSPEKAYFLGWLYSDGNVFPEANKISLGLQEKDKDILEKLNTLIKSNRPLQFIRRDKDFDKNLNREINRQNQYSLKISSSIMCQNLIKLGCVKAKSLILKFPTEEQVPRHLLKHFVQGFWEGDGGMTFGYTKKTTYNSVYFASTMDFCLELKKYLESELGMHFAVGRDSRNMITTTINCNSIPYIIKFLDWLYKDAPLKLERKWQKYQDFLKELQIRVVNRIEKFGKDNSHADYHSSPS